MWSLGSGFSTDQTEHFLNFQESLKVQSQPEIFDMWMKLMKESKLKKKMHKPGA